MPLGRLDAALLVAARRTPSPIARIVFARVGVALRVSPGNQCDEFVAGSMSWPLQF